MKLAKEPWVLLSPTTHAPADGHMIMCQRSYCSQLLRAAEHVRRIDDETQQLLTRAAAMAVGGRNDRRMTRLVTTITAVVVRVLQRCPLYHLL